MRRLRHYLLGIIFLLWVAIFLGRLPPAFQYANMTVILGAALILGGRKLYLSETWRWSTFGTLLAAYVGMRVIWLVFAPLPQFGSLDQAIISVILLLIFVFFQEHFKEFRHARAWENALISLAILFAAFELILASFWFRNWWAISGLGFSWPPVGYRSPGGLLDHPNVLSAFLNLIIPIVLTRWMVGKRRDRRILWAAPQICRSLSPARPVGQVEPVRGEFVVRRDPIGGGYLRADRRG